MAHTHEQSGSVLGNRNFLLLFQGALTSAVAANLYSFAISFYILEITGNDPSVQGTYLFVCGLVYVLCSFVGGVLADRWNRVRIVYGSDLIKGGLILISLLLLRAFIRLELTGPQLAVLFAIGIANNVLAAVFDPASTALIPELVPTEQLMQANSLFAIQRSLVSMLGVLLAAVFYAWLPITALFLIIGVLYLLSGVTELFIHLEHTKQEGSLTVGAVLRDFGEGVRYLWEMKPILSLIAGVLFVNFFVTPLFSNLLPYIIKTDVAGSDYVFSGFLAPESWSAVFSLLFGIGSVLMSVILGQRKGNGRPGMEVKLWLAVMPVLLLGLGVCYALSAGHNISVFLLAMSGAMLLAGVSSAGINLPVSVVIQRDIQKEMLAKVSSIMTIGSQGLIPFSSLLAGVLIAGIGPGPFIFFCAGGLALTTVFICASKSISRL